MGGGETRHFAPLFLVPSEKHEKVALAPLCATFFHDVFVMFTKSGAKSEKVAHAPLCATFLVPSEKLEKVALAPLCATFYGNQRKFQ